MRSKAIRGSKQLTFFLAAAAVFGFSLLQAAALVTTAQASPSSTTPEMAKLVDEHRVLMTKMNALGADGKLRRLDDSNTHLLLDEGWQLAAEWAGAWLDLHPESSADQLSEMFSDFTPPPHDPEVYDPKFPDRYAAGGFTTQVGPDTYVASVAYEESQSANAISTFFVLVRDAGGRFQPKWSIKPVAERHYPKRDEIGRWAFTSSCFYYCGPLVVQRVIPLPASSSGQPRFAVDAFQATNGSTLVKQLSVWQWNGVAAENLAIRSYNLGIEDDRAIVFVGNLLSVPTKEMTESFSSYGCCSEPRGLWILRITPTNIQDLGHQFLQPQILWADRLIAAIGPLSSAAIRLASPSVIAYLRHADIEADAIDKCVVHSRGKSGEFEISLGAGTKIWFSYELRKGEPYFTAARVE